MAEWPLMGHDWPPNQNDPNQHPYMAGEPYHQDNEEQHLAQALPPQALPPQGLLSQALPPYAQHNPPPPLPSLSTLHSSPPLEMAPPTIPYNNPIMPRGDTPRELRNKAEKQRRDKLNQSIAELASMVPPVLAAKRKLDKTGVLRLTAHYLRAYQYVFGNSIGKAPREFSSASTLQMLAFLKGFLITVTYRGLVVVVSQNVEEFIGYTELDLLGKNILTIIHDDDRGYMMEQLMPNRQMLGPNGELLFPDGTDAYEKVALQLATDKREFVVRFKKLSQRTEPSRYLTCHVEGTFRKSDKACRGYIRCCQMGRRARARAENPSLSGNDVVFIGVVRPSTDTFFKESRMEAYKMEYRTRHTVDGEIIQCDQRISLVTGYMIHEVHGVNAMNFMHRDDVRWVVLALREMYDRHRLYGESCYRLMTKNGQFVYMKTKGRLDVDLGSRAVTSFVCTNTLVDEEEGQELIKLMKKKYSMLINHNDNNNELDFEFKEDEANTLPVESPKELKKVIFHLVTNLPCPQSDESGTSALPDERTPLRLAIIPPRKEKIVNAIDKIYSVIKSLPKETEDLNETVENNDNNIPCIDITQDTMSPKPVYNEDDNIFTTESALNFNSNKEVLTNSDQSQNEPLPFNEIYKKHSSNYVYVDKINNHEIDTNLYPTGITDVKFDTLKTVPLTINSEEDIIQMPRGKYNFFTTSQDNSNETNICPDLNVKSSGKLPREQIRSGIKRTSDVEEEFDTMTKKKTADLNETNMYSDCESPSLEKFFDEAILNSEIESAINSLEQTIDPNFPDLLISKEVQDILTEIENAPDATYQPDTATLN